MSNDMIETAIKYFSRKYKVNISKLYSKVEFLEDILIEIHQESYTTKEEKEIITENLFTLKKEIKEKNVLKESFHKYKYSDEILFILMVISSVLGVFFGYFGIRIFTNIDYIVDVTDIVGVEEITKIIYVLIGTISLTLGILSYYELDKKNENEDDDFDTKQ